MKVEYYINRNVTVDMNIIVYKRIDNNMFYYTTDDIEDMPTRALIKNFGSQSHLAVPIYDKLNHLVGFVAMDWVFSEPPNEYIENNEFSSKLKEEISAEVESLVHLL